MITKPIIYTEKYVLNELTDMVNELVEDKNIYLLGELFETRMYHQQRFSEWRNQFENKEISETIKRIKNILEHRLNKKGLEGEINSTLTIFNLKNNYNWKDKSERELSGPDGRGISPKLEIVFVEANADSLAETI